MSKSTFARGREQSSWEYNMLHGGQRSVTALLRGRARRYAARYEESFAHLCARMERVGYQITRTPGIRGGEWGAVYTAFPPSPDGLSHEHYLGWTPCDGVECTACMVGDRLYHAGEKHSDEWMAALRSTQ